MVVERAAPWYVPRRMWESYFNRTGGLQGICNGSCDDLADNDLGAGSGWRQSATLSLEATAILAAPTAVATSASILP